MGSHKFGTIGEGGADVEFRYGNVYAIEQTTGPSRLAIAPDGDHAALLADLADIGGDSFFLLYVLLVGRTGRPDGRYQSSEVLDARQLRAFLDEHGRFLESDGRHHFWIGSPDSDFLLVYDQHNVIYAYGPVQGIEELLLTRGFQKRDVRFPVPHTHHYHAQNDAAEDRLFGACEWDHSLLGDQDEP